MSRTTFGQTGLEEIHRMTRLACSTLALALCLAACGSASSGGDTGAGGSTAAGGSTSAGGGTSAAGAAGAGGGGAAGAAGSSPGGGAAGAPTVPDIPADGTITWVASEPGIGTSTYSGAGIWPPAGSDIEITGVSLATTNPSCQLYIKNTTTPAVGTYPVDGVTVGGFCGSTDVVYGFPPHMGTSAGTLTITSFDGKILKGTATFEGTGSSLKAPGGPAMITSSLAVAFAAKKQ
jgi:hypothetical protein